MAVKKIKKLKKKDAKNALPDDEQELEEILEDNEPEELDESEEEDKKPELSEAEKEQLALQALRTEKVKMEHQRSKPEDKKRLRKVPNPKVELAKTATVIVITLVISIAIFYVAYLDYTSDTSSKFNSEKHQAIQEETAWVFLNGTSEPEVVSDNLSGSETGDDAAKEYKEYYRMNGDFAKKIELGSLTIELNWIYFIVLGMVVFTGPNGIMRRHNINRLKAKEAKFPDFIRDLAEFWKGGLSMSVAVDTLSKGDYGALDEEVDFMATQLSWGVAFNDVLKMFLERVHTGLIERSIALIEEANRAGGKISDIMLNVARDAQEIKMLDREREVTMKSYIFVTSVSFFIYVIIIVVMAYVFIPAIAESTEDLDIESGFGGVKIQSFDPAFIALLFFSSVLVQAIGGGVNAGIMGEGNMGASLWWITLFLLLGTAVFELAGVSMGLA